MHGLGVIVDTERQAEMIIQDILTKVDREDVLENNYEFIIVREKVADWTCLRGYQEMEHKISESVIELGEFYRNKKKNGIEMLQWLQSIAAGIDASAPPSLAQDGDSGRCWLWLKNNRHSLVRELRNIRAVTITASGRYLVDLPEIDARRPLGQKKKLFAMLCDQVRRAVEIDAHCFSIADDNHGGGGAISTDDDIIEDPFFYNLSGA